MTITRTTRWVAGTVALCLVLSAVAWLVLISPQRTTAAALTAQGTSADTAASATDRRLRLLKQESLQLTARRQALAAVHGQMPASADVAGLVTTLSALASSSGVTLGTLTPGVLGALTPAPGATTTATASPSTSSSTGVMEMPVTIAVTGQYFETSLFVKRLQTDIPRAFMVDSFTLTTSGTSEADVAMTIQGRVFTLPA